MEGTHVLAFNTEVIGLIARLRHWYGACGGTRTPDLRITNPMHYQLCYTGAKLPETLTLDE